MALATEREVILFKQRGVAEIAAKSAPAREGSLPILYAKAEVGIAAGERHFESASTLANANRFTVGGEQSGSGAIIVKRRGAGRARLAELSHTRFPSCHTRCLIVQ